MVFKIVLLLSISLAIASVELNIYRSITELRQELNGNGSLRYDFDSNEYSNIVDDSIHWTGTEFTRQEVYNTVESLKGASVRLRRTTCCDCQIITGKIVNPNTMLVENMADHSLFYADPRTIEYVSLRPNEGGKTLQITFKDENAVYRGVLSYLTRSISWFPNYELSFTDDNTCYMNAYANIRNNNQQQEYSIDSTNLYSSDIQLITQKTRRKPQLVVRKVAKSIKPNNSDTQQIKANGEASGIYYYSLKTAYKLRPSSSVRLPFVKFDTKCHFHYKATTNIGSGEYNGIFQRHYEVTPDKFVPAGSITIRDRSILIGQSRWPDTPKNFKQILRFGDDKNIRYSVRSVLLASNTNKERPVWRTYKLEVTIYNFKSKPATGQLDFYGATRTKIEESTCKSMKLTANMINLPFELNHSHTLSCAFTVKLIWG